MNVLVVTLQCYSIRMNLYILNIQMNIDTIGTTNFNLYILAGCNIHQDCL